MKQIWFLLSREQHMRMNRYTAYGRFRAASLHCSEPIGSYEKYVSCMLAKTPLMINQYQLTGLDYMTQDQHHCRLGNWVSGGTYYDVGGKNTIVIEIIGP